MSYYRTAEHQGLRGELIQRWKPWEQSSGPRSTEGNATSARNGYRGGERQGLRALAKLLAPAAIDCRFLLEGDLELIQFLVHAEVAGHGIEPINQPQPVLPFA